MIANKKDKDIDCAHRHLLAWAKWINTDSLSSLGYPSQSATSANIYDACVDHKWRATPHNSRCADVSLPDWSDEMIADSIVRSLDASHRRLLYCQYEVMLDAAALRAHAIPVRRMRLIARDGRYAWPRARLDRIAALMMQEWTYYRALHGAMDAVIFSPDFWKLR